LRPLPILDAVATLKLPPAPAAIQLRASGDPYWFDALGLPTGLSINHLTGLISGEASGTGEFVVRISATNYVGTDYDTLVMTVPVIEYIVGHIAVTPTVSGAFKSLGRVSGGVTPTPLLGGGFGVADGTAVSMFDMTITIPHMLLYSTPDLRIITMATRTPL